MSDVVRQIQENMIAYFRLFGGLAGMVMADGDVFWLVSARGEPGSQILRCRLPEGNADVRIDAMLADIGQYTNQIDWMVFPGDQPADLGERLLARGMNVSGGGNWMICDDLARLPEPPLLEGFTVEWVDNDQLLYVWRQISHTGFGSDVDIHHEAYVRHGYGHDVISLHYIGYQGDTPVTSATLLLAGGIASLWDISTPPQLRQRGYGGAISRHLIHEALARGYRRAWVWSSNMGISVYQRVGFVLTDLGIREYQWRKNLSPGML